MEVVKLMDRAAGTIALKDLAGCVRHGGWQARRGDRRRWDELWAENHPGHDDGAETLRGLGGVAGHTIAGRSCMRLCQTCSRLSGTKTRVPSVERTIPSCCS